MMEVYEIFNIGDMEFIKDGVSLSWEEAKELMVDSTGVNGPLSWELGSYRNRGKLTCNWNQLVRSSSLCKVQR